MDEWISVKVHPNAKKDVLLHLGAGRFEAWVRAKPVGGQATEALTQLLARGLQVPSGALRLMKGRTGRQKVYKLMR